MRIVESVLCDIAVLTGDFAFDDIRRDYKPLEAGSAETCRGTSAGESAFLWQQPVFSVR